MPAESHRLRLESAVPEALEQICKPVRNMAEIQMSSLFQVKRRSGEERIGIQSVLMPDGISVRVRAFILFVKERRIAYDRIESLIAPERGGIAAYCRDIETVL